MPDAGEVANVNEDGVPSVRLAQPLWRRVLFGVEVGGTTERTRRDDESVVANSQNRTATIIVPLVIAVLAFGGGALGSYVTSAGNERAIKAERDRVIEQFRLDQRKARYDEIRQQMTRLENASDISKTAVLAGVGLPFATSGIARSGRPGQLQSVGGDIGLRAAVDQHVAGVQGMIDAQQMLGGGLYGDPGFGAYPDIGPYAGLGAGATRSTWQDAYTGLDQAISNAEIASSDEVINLARALRDKHRTAYYRSIMENIDVVIATYADPKPDKAKLADALVGVPAETTPPTYDVTLLDKSTDELTVMYVKAAKEDLELNDR